MSTAIHETLAAQTPSTATTPLPAAAPDTLAPDPALTQDPATPETHTYRGRTVEELIPKIQTELGPDAIVIRRQSGLTGGFAGFFQRPYVEIEARRGSPRVDRYDEDDAAPVLPGELDDAGLDSILDAPHDAAGDAHFGAALDAELDAAPARPSALDEEFRELTATSLEAEPTVTPQAPLTAPVALPAPFAAALAAAEAAAGSKPPTNLQALAPQPSVSRSRARDAIERRLLEVGVGEELVRELLEAATGHVLPFMPPRTSLARAVQEALRQRIPAPPGLPAGTATIAVVGPGGSGKTSCCAALFDAYDKRSALSAMRATVTAGAQRGAFELQLDPHVPEPLPLTDPRAHSALRQAREEGVMLLDTPPVSPADAAAVRALAALLAELGADRVVLALPATLGAKAAAQLLEAVGPLGAEAIAITHIDETDQLGVAVDAACKSGLAPVYTLGRGRDAGLAQVQPAELAERLLGAQ